MARREIMKDGTPSIVRIDPTIPVSAGAAAPSAATVLVASEAGAPKYMKHYIHPSWCMQLVTQPKAKVAASRYPIETDG